MIKKTLKTLSLIFILTFFVQILVYGQQTNRQWWNSLSPAWKKVFLLDQFKGKEVDPTEEDLERVVMTKRVNCSNNKEIVDLKPLAKLTLLEQVKCSDCPSLKTLEGIENLPNLWFVDCSNNDNIGSIKPLEKVYSLRRLNCGNTMVKNLAPLLNLGNLEELDIHLTTINELIFLKNLKKLTKLDVSENSTLYSIEGIDGATNLIEFNCSKTDISELEPLMNLKNLRVLDISETRVKTLRALQNVKSLQEINCNRTQIRTLKYLFANPNITVLSARGTLVPKEDMKFTIDAITKINYQPKNLILELDN